MKSKKDIYLENIEDKAKLVNGIIKGVSFLGIIGLGLLTFFTGIVLPLIVSVLVFGVSTVDSFVGKISGFKEKDVSPSLQTIGETNHHGVTLTETTPPLLYGLLALPSVFMSNKVENVNITNSAFDEFINDENEHSNTLVEENKNTFNHSKNIEENKINDNIEVDNYGEENEM